MLERQRQTIEALDTMNMNTMMNTRDSEVLGVIKLNNPLI